MNWVRWNTTTHIYELSTDNGAVWNPLLLDAAVINEGALAKARQHAQTAYKDAANVFTAVGNEFDEILKVDKGLQFPATQVASTDANVLDDYEEGEWTPILGGAGGQSGQTYIYNVGRYVKIGKYVYVTGNIALSTKGTITGNLQISGLPFVIENISNVQNALNVGWWSIVTSIVWISGLGIINDSAVELYALTAAAASPSTLTTTNIGDTSQIRFSFRYRAST